MTPAEAYEECAALARASATSFYRGMRVLDGPQRNAMFAIYALARRIDDIADEPGAPDLKQQALAGVRDGLDDLAATGESDAVWVAVRDACARFPIPLQAFRDLVRGAELDLEGRRYPTFDDLVGYCRCVAGSIGRLSLGVYDTGDRLAAEPLADDLGVAFQLTNILRDLREDAAAGRLYLPLEELERFDCSLRGDEFHGPWAELVAFQADRAEEWYARGLGLVPLLDRRSATSVRAMGGTYHRLLHHIRHRPGSVLTERIGLSGWEKSMIAAKSLLGVGG